MCNGTVSLSRWSAVIDGAALRIDDRLRVAKERREEADKQQGKGGREAVSEWSTSAIL